MFHTFSASFLPSDRRERQKERKRERESSKANSYTNGVVTDGNRVAGGIAFRDVDHVSETAKTGDMPAVLHRLHVPQRKLRNMNP